MNIPAIMNKRFMETKENLLEPLLEKAEEYGKTSFELLKLKTVDKTADVISTIFSRVILLPVLMLVIVCLSIAAALWLGGILGRTYYGFLIMAAIYAITCAILFFLTPRIKSKASSFIITQILK